MNYKLENNKIEISSLTDFKKLVVKYNELIEKKKNTTDYVAKLDLQEEINSIYFVLINGIKIDAKLFEPIINKVIEFISSNNIECKNINLLSNVVFYINAEEIASKGKLSALGTKIFIDYSYFDENNSEIVIQNSNVPILNIPYKNFFNHTICHELLHVLSRGETPEYMYDDALSEGLTELFSRKIMKEKEVKSTIYTFSEKVFELFDKLIGDNKIMKDYLNFFPNIPSLDEFANKFENFTKTDLADLINQLSSTYQLFRDKKYEDVTDIQNKIMTKLYYDIVLPFFSFDEEKSKITFMSIFENFDFDEVMKI